MAEQPSPTDRLEALWAGGFGDRYVERNRDASAGRAPFWRERVRALQIVSALEVGCNVGGNLRWLAEALGPERVAGVDVNEHALALARESIPGADLRLAPARALPFADRAFDLVFTAGVLIHQRPEDLPRVQDEIVRCADRFVLCAEYYAPEPVEVPYRGESGALFKRDFGRAYQERHPKLELVEHGFLPASDGAWDDVTYWTFARS